MFGRFGGEGTDQESCWTQQVEHLQYVLTTKTGEEDPRHWGLDADNSIARAVAAAE